MGALAAVLGSVCCLGPLLLLMLGISGAWIANLTVFAAYRPLLIGVALAALLVAYVRIWRAPASCAPARACATPGVQRRYKLLFWIVLAFVVAAFGFQFVAPWFY